jgi:hypothetical protein
VHRDERVQTRPPSPAHDHILVVERLQVAVGLLRARESPSAESAHCEGVVGPPVATVVEESGVVVVPGELVVDVFELVGELDGGLVAEPSEGWLSVEALLLDVVAAVVLVAEEVLSLGAGVPVVGRALGATPPRLITTVVPPVEVGLSFSGMVLVVVNVILVTGGPVAGAAVVVAPVVAGRGRGATASGASTGTDVLGSAAGVVAGGTLWTGAGATTAGRARRW